MIIKRPPERLTRSRGSGRRFITGYGLLSVQLDRLHLEKQHAAQRARSPQNAAGGPRRISTPRAPIERKEGPKKRAAAAIEKQRAPARAAEAPARPRPRPHQAQDQAPSRSCAPRPAAGVADPELCAVIDRQARPDQRPFCPFCFASVLPKTKKTRAGRSAGRKESSHDKIQRVREIQRDPPGM